jgi:methyl-accepting chemotaxis protein
MKGSKLNILWSIFLGGFFPLGLDVFCTSVWPDWKWIHAPLHSVFESLGLFAGISLATILLFHEKQGEDNTRYLWIAPALIAMSIMDGFHAAVSPGNAFVWLHSMSIFIGGLLFFMVWAPLKNVKLQTARQLAAFVAAAVIFLGIFSLAFPETLPLMIEDRFTPAASIINITGGIFFVMAAIFFLVRYWKNKETEEILFAFFCFLNGSSGLLFPFGSAWGISWWVWHVLRLIAFFILLGYISAIFIDLAERQRIAEMLKKRTAELMHLLEKVKETVNILSSSSSEILAATTQVASGTSETATAISETTTTVEEVRQAAQLSSRKAQNLSENAEKVVQISRTGQKAVEETAAGMLHIRNQMESIANTIVRLSEQGQSIGGIIATVTDLADQSNLLAVNAAIEAAGAGEQGRRFAVVAQEIRSLAEQSKQATAQVRDILNDLQKATSAAVMATEQGNKAVNAGVKQSAQAGEAIETLSKSTEEAMQVAIQIVTSSKQQEVGMDQICTAMENINQAGVETVASMRQSEEAAKNLHELGNKLKEMMEQFKV